MTACLAHPVRSRSVPRSSCSGAVRRHLRQQAQGGDPLPPERVLAGDARRLAHHRAPGGAYAGGRRSRRGSGRSLCACWTIAAADARALGYAAMARAFEGVARGSASWSVPAPARGVMLDATRTGRRPTRSGAPCSRSIGVSRPALGGAGPPARHGVLAARHRDGPESNHADGDGLWGAGRTSAPL